MTVWCAISGLVSRMSRRLASGALIWLVAACGLVACTSTAPQLDTLTQAEPDSTRQRAMRRSTKEILIKQAFLATAVTSLAVLALIMIFLFMEGLPAFSFVSVKDFLLGVDWYPTDEANPAYGILPLIAASGAVTALSSLLAIPLGVMTAVYLAEIASPRVRAVVKPVVEMLASLPSVVIGFFGRVVMASPWAPRTWRRFCA